MPTTAQPGDVVLVRFPFTDLSTAKLRPAVVLAAHGDDLTIVGIFSGIAVIEQSIVVRKLGSLTPAKMDEVKRAIKLTLNLS